MNFVNIIKKLKPYFWRLLFIILGFTVAILFLVIGFGKTMLILLCCILGCGIGWLQDKNIRFLELLRYWRNRW